MSEPYILLRAALGLFKKAPTELGDAELQQVQKQARNELVIENRVLNALEATGVIISDEEIAHAYAEIQARYDDDSHFLAELAKNALDETSLRSALARQCKVNAVLDRVGSRAPSINDVDIGLYYHLRHEKFAVPERRSVSHIFISINADYAENTREAALQRANELHAKLLKKPYKFSDLALRHSECPTALQGGELGIVPRGTLYPELDAVLFTLKTGDISAVVESEIGLHILLCKQIHKAETLSLAKATPKIRALMEERTRQNCIREWLAGLPKE
ncbi:MAG: nitrogen fixation protein NifM [Methylococcales bacterium]|nr:nitrogen fixation protein NifM [Methylococcales bacterium]